MEPSKWRESAYYSYLQQANGNKGNGRHPRHPSRRLIIGARSMSSQYPEPPTDAYTPIYPAPPSSALDARPPQIPYPQDIFPKIESLNDVLQQQASHALGDPRNNAIAQQPPQGESTTQKTIRLRKACDSCSIRKVKVCGRHC